VGKSFDLAHTHTTNGPHGPSRARHSSPTSRAHYNIRYVLLIQLLYIYIIGKCIHTYRWYTHTHTHTQTDRVIITIAILPQCLFLYHARALFVYTRTSAVRFVVFRLFHRRPSAHIIIHLIYPSRRSYRFLGVHTYRIYVVLTYNTRV